MTCFVNMTTIRGVVDTKEGGGGGYVYTEEGLSTHQYCSYKTNKCEAKITCQFT